MNLKELSDVLTKMYNKLGNKYLTDNFITEPFEFEVNVRMGGPYEYHDYYAEVYCVPDMPNYFQYRPEVRKEKNKWADGVDISVVITQFQKMIEYVDSKRKGKIGINFMSKKK